MLSKVELNLHDSNGGAGSGSGTGIFGKVGVSPVESATPVLITGNMDAAMVREKLGNSPLADACIDSIENGAATIYAMPVKETTHGKISQAVFVGEGKATIEAKGNPTNEFTLIIEIETGGLTNAATCVISENGGQTWSEEQTIPLSGKITVPNTGVELTFTASEGNEFQAGDTYTFEATAPSANNGDILDAVKKFRTHMVNVELIHVVGVTTAALWGSLESLGSSMETQAGKPLFFVCEQRNAAESENAGAYVESIAPEAKSVKGRHVCVVSQWARYIRMDGREQVINMAGVITGSLAAIKESSSLAYTGTEGISYPEGKVVKLLPEGIEDYMEVLDESRYMFLRKYEGLEGYYVAASNMTAPASSDYANVEDVRVMYRLAREVYKRALLHQNEDFDQNEAEVYYTQVQEDLNVPIDTAKNRDHIISDGRVTILADMVNTGKDKRLPVRIQCVPRGYTRELKLDMYVVNALA